MNRRTAEWILWALTMLVFLALALTRHVALLGIAIVAVAIVWYGIVPEPGSGRQ